MTSRPKSAAQRALRHLSRTAPVVPPIYQTTTFFLDEVSYDDVIETSGLNEDWYSRFHNLTVAVTAEEVARLEGASAALMTSSGMAAIATTLLSLCGAGDRIVAARELYGDTYDLLTRDLPRLGIEVEFVRGDSLAAWEAALAAKPAAVAYAETLSNPQLRLLDIPAVARRAHDHLARLVIDNTFASPAVVRPLAPGRAGAMVSFVVREGDRAAGAVMRNFEVAIEATSLGGVETLASTPHNSSHFSLSVAEREAAGIPAGLIRLSVGLEPADR